jgi:DNA-directed RNA polymerase specialized sigma24 family protein
VDVPDRAPNPEQLCWASELRDILVRTLKERFDLADGVCIPYVDGLSIKETAQLLNLSQEAVKARLWRVRSHTFANVLPNPSTSGVP